MLLSSDETQAHRSGTAIGYDSQPDIIARALIVAAAQNVMGHVRVVVDGGLAGGGHSTVGRVVPYSSDPGRAAA